MNKKSQTKQNKPVAAARPSSGKRKSGAPPAKAGLSKSSNKASNKKSPAKKPASKRIQKDEGSVENSAPKRKEYTPARKSSKSAAEKKAESWIEKKAGEQRARNPRSQQAKTEAPKKTFADRTRKFQKDDSQVGGRQSDSRRGRSSSTSTTPSRPQRSGSPVERRNNASSEKPTRGSRSTTDRKSSSSPAARSALGSSPRTDGKFSRKAREHQISFAQNFVKNPALVRKIVAKSSITKNSTVLEIGPGKGILTRELARASRNVIAIEKDPSLFQELKKQFSKNENISLIQGDFLLRKDKLAQKVVFANPPFNLFSRIMQKLLWSEGVPDHIYMFGQREAVNRFCGAGRDFVNHILLSPWFTPKVVYRFERQDFVPVPNVDVVLVHIRPRPTPLLPRNQQRAYTDFVQFGYRFSTESLGQVYRRIFTPKQWYRLAHEGGFDEAAKARELTRDQWVQLYAFYAGSVDPARRRLVR
jgi:23S rRNA (adenine-N6)-dimethyltransferase